MRGFPVCASFFFEIKNPIALKIATVQKSTGTRRGEIMKNNRQISSSYESFFRPITVFSMILYPFSGKIFKNAGVWYIIHIPNFEFFAPLNWAQVDLQKRVTFFEKIIATEDEEIKCKKKSVLQ